MTPSLDHWIDRSLYRSITGHARYTRRRLTKNTSNSKSITKHTAPQLKSATESRNHGITDGSDDSTGNLLARRITSVVSSQSNPSRTGKRAKHTVPQPPLHSTPLHSTPLHSTPLHSSPRIECTPCRSHNLHRTTYSLTKTELLTRSSGLVSSRLVSVSYLPGQLRVAIDMLVPIAPLDSTLSQREGEATKEQMMAATPRILAHSQLAGSSRARPSTRWPAGSLDHWSTAALKQSMTRALAHWITGSLDDSMTR